MLELLLVLLLVFVVYVINTRRKVKKRFGLGRGENFTPEQYQLYREERAEAKRAAYREQLAQKKSKHPFYGLDYDDPVVKPGYTRRYDIVGEWHRRHDIESLVSHLPVDSYNRIFAKETALLVPEFDNEHDSKAIMVIIDGVHVGYIARGETKEVHRIINNLEPGKTLAGRATIELFYRDDDSIKPRISVAINDYERVT